MRFRDRTEAGRLLADRLISYANRSDVQVLALPRGGVPVAYEAAWRLNAPLDVWLVRKLGAPSIPELAIGAIATGGVQTVNGEAVRRLSVSREQIDEIVARERQELERREAAYRGNRPPLDVRGATVILIDDGIATGASMHAAVTSVGQREAKEIVVAVPVAAPSACAEIEREADRVVCLLKPADLNSVGEWYQDFSQTTDDEVRNLLDRAREFAPRAGERTR